MFFGQNNFIEFRKKGVINLRSLQFHFCAQRHIL